MKRLFLLFALFAVLALNGASQSIFKPIPKNLFKTDGWALNKTVKPSEWIPRISAGVIATQWTFSSGQIHQESFSKVGLGMSYAHFIEQEGLPYNNVSINGFVFFPTDGTTKITLAVTTSVLKYIQIGLDYDFALNKPGLLTGISYTF